LADGARLGPYYTIMGPRFSTGLGIAAASLLAAVWLICLRSAFAAVPLTLGLPIRCAVGLTRVSSARRPLPLGSGLGMSFWTILALAASVFMLTTIWRRWPSGRRGVA
jgi:hypothetical protein